MSAEAIRRVVELRYKKALIRKTSTAYWKEFVALKAESERHIAEPDIFYRQRRFLAQ